MLSKQLHIFIQYPIKESVIQQYEETMQRVLRLMGDIGANEFKWSREYQQNGVAVYRETFLLPTEAHYFALKELRCSTECTTFNELSQWIDKEAGLPVQYLGLKITNEHGGLL